MAAKPGESPAAPAVIPLSAARDPVVEFSGEEGEEEKKGEAREVKRRRTCPPLALQKISSPPPPTAAVAEEEDEQSRRSGRGGFSFSFDTNGIAPIETTPKFGSFSCSADLLALGDAKEGEEKAKNGTEEDGVVKNESGTAIGRV